ncbi:MAG TPA: S-layer homology domain-containing protein [Chloroflexia bacterium]|nr:S-layer homology domain-containing protein [Chloroflexia bacterium]
MKINSTTRAAINKRRYSSRLVTVALALVLAGFVAASGTWSTASAQSPQPKPERMSPQAACPPDGRCFADVMPSNPFYNYANTLYREDIVTGYACGGPGEPCDASSRPYFRPNSAVTRQQMTKFIDAARTQPGIFINTSTSALPLYSRTTVLDGIALYGESSNGDAISALATASNRSAILARNTGGGFGVYADVTGNGYGVWARSGGQALHGETTGNADAIVGRNGTSGRSGVYGLHTGSGLGVTGRSTSGIGVLGDSAGDNGVMGQSSSSGDSGVYGYNTNGGFGVAGRTNANSGIFAAVFGENTGGGYAAYFSGATNTRGTGTASLGTYTIDHPQDPANKYLNMSAVAGPEAMNVYNGNVTTDANGDATVTLPAYVESLNKDFRYQLTVIGTFAQAIVSTEIQKNSFTIKTDKPNVKVSWQVTGVRKDPYAEKSQPPVEQDKPSLERGYYRHPEVYGQPDSKSVEDAYQP